MTVNLAISDNDTIVHYTSVGESTFSFDFPILAADELVVMVDGVVVTNYTIAGIGDAGGGSITFTSATTSGEKITIYQDLPLTRATGFSGGAAVLLADAMNDEFARQLRIDQQLRRDVERSIRLNPDDPSDGDDFRLGAAGDRADKILGFDANGKVTFLTKSTDAISQSVATPNFDTTAAETALSITPSDKSVRPASLYGTGLRYGLSESNSAADNKTALQAFFNVVRQGKSNIAQLPPGTFDVEGPVYPYYDAAGNANGPSHAGQALQILGAGAPSRRSLPDGVDYHGTVLNFTNATGGGLIVGNGTTAVHTVIRGLGLVGGMSDELLYLRALARLSMVEDLFIGMTGSGIGIRTFSFFTMTFRHLEIWGDAASPDGIGFWADTSQGAGGGNARFEQITASELATGLRFGSPYAAGNFQTKNQQVINCQGRFCTGNDVEFLDGFSGEVVNNWQEGDAHAVSMLVADETGPLRFNGGVYSGSAAGHVADVQIGRVGGNVHQCSVGKVSFLGPRFELATKDSIAINLAPAISNCADNGAGLIRVTQAGHGLTTGDIEMIRGVVGTTEANDNWAVTVVDSDNYDLDSSTFANAYVAGGHAFTQSGPGVSIKDPQISNNGGYLVSVSRADYVPGGLELDDLDPDLNSAGSELSPSRFVVDGSNNRAEYLVTRGGRGLERYSLVCAGGSSGSPDLDMRGWLEAPAVTIRCATTGGGGYIYLPDPPKIGTRIKFWKDNAANDVVIDPGSARSIAGFSSTLTLESANDFVLLELVEDDTWIVVASRITASTTWDPASIADGDEVAQAVTLSGAELGQHVVASFSLDVSDLVVSAQVTAADTVRVVLANNTGAPVDLASGTLSVRLIP